MSLLKSYLQPFLPKAYPTSRPFPKPGVYHYLREDGRGKIRLHLRVEKPGAQHLLLINASRVLHLNESAAGMAYLWLEMTPENEACRQLAKWFNGSEQAMRADYQVFASQLDDLVYESACPVHELELEILQPFSARPSAPYRMDLALTYRCNDDCAHCYNARPRDYPEMPTEQWKRVLDKLWDTGIPHVVFTGGEPTLRNDLPELIAYAEKKGQITGLNTNARRLSDARFVKQLVDAGLDHVQITVESHLPEIHDGMVRSPGAWRQTIKGLENVLATRLFVMTNTTMLRQNSPSLRETLIFLAQLGVPTIGLNALIYSGRGKSAGTGLSEKDLLPLLEIARQETERRQQRLIWYTPTQYCNFDPVQMDLGVKGCTAALYNMCIEPDGKVLPCQSYYRPVGDILRDDWDTLWNHRLAADLRERKNLPQKCGGCLLLAECGGGCPLMFEPEPLITL